MLNATVRAINALRRLRPDRTATPTATRTLRDQSVALGRLLARGSGAAPLGTPGMTRGLAPTRLGAAKRPLRTFAHPVTPREKASGRLVALFDGAADRLGRRLGGRERLLPIVVAILVLVGSLSSIATAAPAGAVGGVTSAGDGPRLAIAGLQDGGPGGDVGAVGTNPADTTIGGTIDGSSQDSLAARVNLPAESQSNTIDQPDGPYLADGTLLKPIAVSTVVADGAGTLQNYQVRSGDTLTGIARHFGISMMTLWWANHLTSKDALHVGQVLVIPPVNGTVRVVKEGETIEQIAAQAKVSVDEIVSFNGLTETTLVVGQTLMLPGSLGPPIATPKPVAHTASSGSHSTSSGGSHAPAPRTYGGGTFAWPVPGGYISQYFHYSHPALDIAAPYGTRVLAAASGTVIYAGWKDNGGGYQVWIAHGSGLFTTYNHMSAVLASVGQHVSRSQQVGRVGSTGNSTGPHCHFEVWRNEVWGNGYRVNPLDYL